ncbi:hypothetical protein BaRGS_00032287 [Batillaria attramentaria]|uniref:Upstream activation factor subunit spp27 n=1 Tax=Batillaria attramentaria TaxID=370345 RepID=A0ABD0JNC3_9CAEN
MTDIAKESLQRSIKAILKDADLDSLSAKKIRKMLEAEYKADFTDRKEEIDKLVMAIITSNENGSDAEEDTKEKVKNGHSESDVNTASEKEEETAERGDASESNEEESSDDGVEDLEDEVPKKKARISSPAGKSKKSPKKVNDEELAKKLQDEEFDTRPSRRCTSLYSRPCALLPPLSKVLGTDRMPRPEVVKKLWEIAKERNLQDPSNKQFMLCDEEMLELFGRKKVRLFGMMKHLKPYIKDLPQE